MEIERLDVAAAEDAVPALAELLCDAVASGDGVSFLAGVTMAEAEAFWHDRVVEAVRGGRAVLLAAFDDDRLLGTVSVHLAWQPNSQHRAELAKLIVHSAARRQGVGRALLAAAEDAARELGRTLLVLDTVSDSAAEHLYRSAGYKAVGRIDAYALMPDGTPAPATILCKQLVEPQLPESLRIRGARVADSAVMGLIQVRAWQLSYRGALPDEFLDGLPPGLRESQWREALTYQRSSDRFWILDRDGEVLGFAHTGTSQDRDAVTGSAEIFAVYLRPEDVAQGLGRLLLDHALADMRKRGAHWITAWVFEGADRARHVFEAMGMREDGAERLFTALGEPRRELRYRMAVRRP
jgi:ribosomal protein S18 acetylase RimI-like enzyme